MKILKQKILEFKVKKFPSKMKFESVEKGERSLILKDFEVRANQSTLAFDDEDYSNS